ncbi:DNA-binding transcriptional regulator, IclR family [Halolactibacillus halophilus]|uniref:DNA-binding transcriptional regulator, IclR family n=1 Tax=Halolactibacillus halophilus TaxID=306540 RepID=A0A1I5RHU5_9BACI|nr:IclR family transcriptional regulator [Halolactibacillus halophilus]GEM02822.1 IclR family transcriptional regulator [Halolactibacillus halophilus]SFP58144.1 DNA-binding transcriptional regulator, IclR family [Halolactibacillus halophilus]
MNKTVLRTISIMELVSNHNKGITLSEISKEIGAPVSSVSDILKSLVYTGMLEIADEKLKYYSIGMKSFLIGRQYVNNINIYDIAMKHVDDLSTKLNNTVFLGRLAGDHLTYIYKSESKRSVSSTCSIGSQSNLHTTAQGKVILAYNADIAEAALKKELKPKTSRSFTDASELRKELAAIRTQGYAIDDREDDEQLYCVSAPIYDVEGKVITAISISGLYDELRDIKEEIKAVKETANIISRKLGYFDDNDEIVMK